MDEKKLIETRGETPAFLPGHVDETWRRVDFGLGASTIQSSPEVTESLPPRSFPWRKVLALCLLSAAGAALLIVLLRLL